MPSVPAPDSLTPLIIVVNIDIADTARLILDLVYLGLMILVHHIFKNSILVNNFSGLFLLLHVIIFNYSQLCVHHLG
jgi:hypothetical protein